MERLDVFGQVADPGRADLDGPGADSHRSRTTIPVSVAVLGQQPTLVAGSSEELVDLGG